MSLFVQLVISKVTVLLQSKSRSAHVSPLSNICGIIVPFIDSLLFVNGMFSGCNKTTRFSYNCKSLTIWDNIN